MRFIIAALALAVALAACGQQEPPPPLPELTAEAVTPPWLICDALDAPVLLRFERANGVATVTQYEKPSGATVQTSQYTLSEPEGAAGSVYTTLMQHGAEAGAIRQTNAGVLETPASAYTPRFTSVRLGEREVDCRWMPRTRVFGFTGRRSFVIHEDRDGDLIYTTYDFAGAAEAQRIELSENAQTTSFSVEVRGGVETVGPEGVAYTFENEGFRYAVNLPRAGAGSLAVTRAGAAVQDEPLIAYVQGDAAATE